MSEAEKQVPPAKQDAAPENDAQAKAAEQAKREKNRKANLAAMQLLLDAYPEVFTLENARPLKVGIHEALAEDGKLSKTKIRRALATYVRQTAYLKALVEGAERVDLQGQAGGAVSADEASHAQEELAKRQARRKPQQNRRKPMNKGPRRNSNAGGKAKHQQAPRKHKPEQKKSAVEEVTGTPEERMQKKLEQLLATMGKK
ncbi:ProQ/FINO family protein [Salinibius halmophilus]|uniref:ProQ/FINO family protein n=1 Tax=Salinibius halmophilus TaxID=1853216 RepID=UPI000E662D24|nr:ProQ/FinO family protein [Salinibius halmophilus]